MSLRAYPDMKTGGKAKIPRLTIAAWGLVLIAAVFFLQGWHSPKGNPVKQVRVGGAVVQAEVVQSPDKVAQGLAGRRALDEGRGMLFLMPERKRQVFWMQGMRFPLDIIWVDQGRIIGLERNVPPGEEHIVTSPEPAAQVLEVPAGFSERRALKPGDKVTIGD